MSLCATFAETVDPAVFGFSPDAAPDVNAKALQRALDGGRKTVKTAKGGVYGMDRTVFIDSDTTLEFAPGTVLKKMARYANVIVNRGAFNYGCDSNIVVRNLDISVNGMQSANGPDSNAPGLRGHFAFYRVKNAKCYNFTCNDCEGSQYCWQAVDYDGLLLDGFTIRGRKDGVHLNRGRNFVVRNGVLRTGDDGVALNAGDWPGGCTPTMGSIENGVVENIVDEEGGKCNFARVITGVWQDWHRGMKLQRDDILRVGKRVYAVHPMPLGTNEYVSLTAPAHRHGVWKSPEGINFQFLQEDGETRADIRNVTFRNIRMECPRAISCSWELGSWARLVHPEIPLKDYPVIDIRLENVVKTAPGPIVTGNACANIEFDNVRSEKGAILSMSRSRINAGDLVYSTVRNIKVRNCTFDGPERTDLAFQDPDGSGTIELTGNKASRPVKIMGRLVDFAISGDTPVDAHAPTIVHVDADRGDDSGDGSAARPYKTTAKAQKAVRAIKKKGAPYGVVVEMEGVFSTLSDPLINLAQGDSGVSPTAPVVWRAGRRGALLTGACRLTAADFKPVSGTARSRLKPEVQDKVYECDLAKLGVGELKPLPAKFNTWSEMELVSSGRAMTIARYPNSGWLEITNVIDRGVAPKDLKKGEWEFGVRGGTFEYPGDAPARWDVSKGVYVFGFWCYDWASDTLRLAKIDTEKKTFTTEGVHVYGIGKASKWAKAKPRYFVYNLLEELDAPGEWYVDRETRTLYFYPTERGFDDVALSLAKKPLVNIINAANIVVKGLEFKHTTDLAVYAGGSSDVVLDGLVVSWVSRSAVKVWGGRNVTVRNCRMFQIGGAGLTVNGGDRKSLTKCNHRVCRNDIGFCGRLSRIDGPCCRFGGCGVTIDHNYFHDTPYIAMSYGGNEHLIEFNDIECAMLEAADGAGMYTGRDWGSRGNVVRWNYLHHFGADGVALRREQGRPSECESLKNDVMVEGIYLDDCDSGETIYGNLFYKAGRALYTGGGRDNKWTHNLVIDSSSAAHLDTRGLQRARPGSGIKDGWDLLARIEAMAYTNEPWASRYPELIGVMQKEPLLPIGTEYVSNVAVNCGHFFNTSGYTTKFLRERAPNLGNVSVNAIDVAREMRDFPQTNAVLRANLEIRKDDALSNAAKSTDPRLLQDSPEFIAAFPGFPRIPVEQIGRRE